MEMISHRVAFGLGYTCARPEGRRRLRRLRDQMLQRKKPSEVTELRDHAWKAATSKVMAAKVSLDQKVRRSITRPTPAADRAGADLAAGIGLEAVLAGRAGTLHPASAPVPPAEPLR